MGWKRKEWDQRGEEKGETKGEPRESGLLIFAGRFTTKEPPKGGIGVWRVRVRVYRTEHKE